MEYYNDFTFQWEGRELRTAFSSSGLIVFAYYEDGTRMLKNNNGFQTDYYYDGTRLIAEKNPNETIIYIYDDYGSVIGMQYRLTTYAEDTWDVYWFEHNLQGDIVGVYDKSGTKLISYAYDAWGNFTTTYYNNGASTTAVKNPFRYRGYYYDSDLQLYYLQTRYYDSVTGKFISADSYISTGQGVLGHNMFAYCNNNPVMYIDPSGESWISILVIGVIGVFLLTNLKSSEQQELTPEQVQSAVEAAERADIEEPEKIGDSYTVDINIDTQDMLSSVDWAAYTLYYQQLYQLSIEKLNNAGNDTGNLMGVFHIRWEIEIHVIGFCLGIDSCKEANLDVEETPWSMFWRLFE